MITFTKYFGVLKTQSELDFVDIDLKNDTPLFIDPWLIKDSKTQLGRECAKYLQSYFDEVMDAIRSGDQRRAMHLLDNLHEVNWTHFGYSVRGMHGKAIATEHAAQIYYALKNSAAFKTGALKDIEDTALLIPMVGKDKISDIVTNVCLPVLVAYTNEQAKLHAIPQKTIGFWSVWSPTSKKWLKGEPCVLPVYNGKPILLVPKALVNTELAVNSSDFYNKYILGFEQQRHLNDPTSGLCRVLKDGTRKEPTKKDLRKIIPCTNAEIVRYVNEHPELLRQYKNDLVGKKTVKKPKRKR